MGPRGQRGVRRAQSGDVPAPHLSAAALGVPVGLLKGDAPRFQPAVAGKAGSALVLLEGLYDEN